MLSDPMIRWEFPSSLSPSSENSLFLKEGVLLAVDWGDRRIGLALSDRERRFSWPIDPVLREKPGKFSAKKDPSLLKSIRELVLDEKIVGMIFGVPYYHLSGDPNPKASDFLLSGRDLSMELSLPILFWDEGLSSETARSDPFSQRIRKKGKAFTKDPWIDSKSASLVLESFLTAIRYASQNSLETVLPNKGGYHPNES